MGACNRFPLSPSTGDLSPLQGRLLRPLTSRCGCGSLEVGSPGPGGHPDHSPVEDTPPSRGVMGRKLSAEELMLLNCGVGEDS